MSLDKKLLIQISKKENSLKIAMAFALSLKSMENFSKALIEESGIVQVNQGLLHDIAKNLIKLLTGKDLITKFQGLNTCKLVYYFPIYNGNILEESIPDEGKKLYIRPTLALHGSTPMKILVVDDIVINFHIAKSILKDLKVEVIGVTSGQEALDLLLKFTHEPYKIQVILMDCMMPEMDGWETTEKILEYFQSKKITYLPYIIGHSAIENQKDIEKCIQTGMNDFIGKPSPKFEYLNTISKWLLEPIRL